MNNRIAELYKQIHDAEIELNAIRSTCPHSNGHHIMYYSWRVGAMYPSRICNTCDAPLNGITDEERDKFLKEEAEKNKKYRLEHGIPEIE